jgi:hypothetical protein
VLLYTLGVEYILHPKTQTEPTDRTGLIEPASQPHPSPARGAGGSVPRPVMLPFPSSTYPIPFIPPSRASESGLWRGDSRGDGVGNGGGALRRRCLCCTTPAVPLRYASGAPSLYDPLLEDAGDEAGGGSESRGGGGQLAWCFRRG